MLSSDCSSNKSHFKDWDRDNRERSSQPRCCPGVLYLYICALYLHGKYRLISIYLKICTISDNYYTMRLDLNY